MVIPRDILPKGSPVLHFLSNCGEAIQFPLGNLDQSLLPNTVFPFLAFWLKGIRSPKWPGEV